MKTKSIFSFILESTVQQKQVHNVRASYFEYPVRANIYEWNSHLRSSTWRHPPTHQQKAALLLRPLRQIQRESSIQPAIHLNSVEEDEWRCVLSVNRRAKLSHRNTPSAGRKWHVARSSSIIFQASCCPRKQVVTSLINYVVAFSHRIRSILYQ